MKNNVGDTLIFKLFGFSRQIWGILYLQWIRRVFGPKNSRSTACIFGFKYQQNIMFLAIVSQPLN